MKYKVIVYTRESKYEPLFLDIVDVMPAHDVSYDEHTKRFHTCAHEMIRVVRDHCEWDERVKSIRRELGYFEIVTENEDGDETIYTLNSINTISK